MTQKRNLKPIEKSVLIEVLTLCGIGGIGRAGDRGYVTAEQAKEYVQAKQARIVQPETAEPVKSDAAGDEADSDAENEPE